MNVDFLYVSCNKEQTRFDLQEEVLQNLRTELPKKVLERFTCVDNASTIAETPKQLKNTFDYVIQFNQNYGLWSAINWWLQNTTSNSEFCYIVESDMFHYDFDKFFSLVEFLEKTPDIGAARCQEYSFKNMHLYDKHNQVEGSVKYAWQTHKNRVTSEKVRHELADEKNEIYTSNFLTQLPAINRRSELVKIFDVLSQNKNVDEFEFQKLYHETYKKTCFIEGGIYRCPNNLDNVTMNGSWESESKIKQIGYRTTRIDKIEKVESYILL